MYVCKEEGNEFNVLELPFPFPLSLIIPPFKVRIFGTISGKSEGRAPHPQSGGFSTFSPRRDTFKIVYELLPPFVENSQDERPVRKSVVA